MNNKFTRRVNKRKDMTATQYAASTAASVANEFLKLWANDPNVPPIDQMKLQKLLFYAHAWYISNRGVPLFEDDFEAWPWGPILRDIYAQTAKYGREPLKSRLYEIGLTASGDYSFITPDGICPEDSALRDFVKVVWDTYKDYTGIQLSNMTHGIGEPWTIVKERFEGDLSSKPKIPNEIIQSVFKKKISDATP